MRKLVAVLFLVCVAGYPASAQQTAYSAMRVLAKARDQKYLGQIIEISGIQGSSQPLVWKILIEDSSARGGFREFEISGDAVLSERTPVRGYVPPANGGKLIPKRVNFDSDAAFQLANQQARNLRISFYTANYALRARPADRLPLWTVDLIDLQGRPTAQVVVDADKGAVLEAGKLARSDAPTTWPESDTKSEGGVVAKTKEGLSDTGQSLKSAGRAAGNQFLRGAATVQEWLTGRRTIDRDVPPE